VEPVRAKLSQECLIYCLVPRSVHVRLVCIEKLSQWKSFVEEGVVNLNLLKSNLQTAEEAFEIINWYLFFIPVKIKRALHDQMDGFWVDYPDVERSDLGTAKIAAIAIERSLGAWGLLYGLFPEEEERLVEILALLEKMRRGLIEVFPNYPKFIRPGFDDLCVS
jgi:hypothetical protein